MFSFVALGLAAILGNDGYKFITPERHEVLSSHIPDSKDGVLDKIRKDSRLLIYTEKEMPKAYQDFAGALPGIHSPSYNISADKPRELYGNPNVEFPWGSPAGTESVPDENFSTFKFLLLPKDKPIVVSKKFLPGDRRSSYVWVYPEGAVVGEVLQIYYKEKYFTFEVRLRSKSSDGWKMTSYRPFATLKEFQRFCIFNGEELSVTDKRVYQSHQIFKGDVTTTSLGKLSDDLIKKALSQKFVNALGQEWNKDAFAPTTEEAFHIVPKGFKAATIAVDTKSCTRCHESTLKHASDFDFNRDWYGRVRGSDGIFSFHPFSPGVISYSGIYQGESLRQELIDAGIVKFE